MWDEVVQPQYNNNPVTRLPAFFPFYLVHCKQLCHTRILLSNPLGDRYPPLARSFSCKQAVWHFCSGLAHGQECNPLWLVKLLCLGRLPNFL
jgi:hypothetical protein